MGFTTESGYLLYPIDWNDPPRIRRAWSTNVMTSMDGREQRTMLRTIARHTLSTTICTREETETAELRRMLHYAQYTIWGVPLWPYEMKLAVGVSPGAGSLTVQDATGREVSSIGRVMIGSRVNYDICAVGSVSGNVITLSGELVTKTWAANQKLYPLLRCEMLDKQEFSQPTPFHYKASFEFVESFVVD